MSELPKPKFTPKLPPPKQANQNAHQAIIINNSCGLLTGGRREDRVRKGKDTERGKHGSGENESGGGSGEKVYRPFIYSPSGPSFFTGNTTKTNNKTKSKRRSKSDTNDDHDFIIESDDEDTSEIKLTRPHVTNKEPKLNIGGTSTIINRDILMEKKEKKNMDNNKIDQIGVGNDEIQTNIDDIADTVKDNYEENPNKKSRLSTSDAEEEGKDREVSERKVV